MDERAADGGRRDYLRAVAGLTTVGTIGLAGCQELEDALEAADDATGTLTTHVTDQPGDIADFESCVVTIGGVWVKPSADEASDGDGDRVGDGDPDGDGAGSDDDGADAASAGSGVIEQGEDDVDRGDGREYYEFDDPQKADLVELQDGRSEVLDSRALPVGWYDHLQFDVAGVEGTLDGGESVPVSTPGNAPLQFTERFEIREGLETAFVGDVTPVRRGATGEYLLQPVANGIEVVYERAESENDTGEPGDSGDDPDGEREPADERDPDDDDGSDDGGDDDDGDDGASVAPQLQVVHAVANVSSESATTMAFTLMKSTGSPPIDLTNLSVEYTSGTAAATLTHGGVGTDGASASTFGTEGIIDDDHTSLDTTDDRVEIVLDSAAIEGGTGLGTGESATIEFVDESGATITYGVSMPSTTGNHDIVPI